MRIPVLRRLAVPVLGGMLAATAPLARAATGAPQSPELRPGLWEFTLSGTDETRRRVCLTPTMVKDLKALAAAPDPASDCKISNERLIDATRAFEVSCTQPRRYRANVTVTVHGPDYFIATRDYVVAADGRELRGRLSVTYRRVGDCR